MTTRLIKKYATARRLMQTEGAKAVLLEGYSQVNQKLNRGKIERWVEKWMRGIDNPWLGRLIERRGDIVTIEGCAFSVRNPAITTDVKSRFLFGRYEKPERRALKKFLDPEVPVVEFGAAIGVIACLTNKRLSDPKKHVVVEANPDLLPLLEENRVRNNCQFTILHRAVAHECEQVTFNLCENYLGSSVQAAAERSISVPATTLLEVMNSFNFERCSLVCDIEGGEADLVRFEAETLAQKVKTLIIEVHPWALGAATVQIMLAELKRIGFESVYQKDATYVFQNRLNEFTARAVNSPGVP